MKTYHRYKKKKYQLNKLIDMLDAVEYVNPDCEWEPSTLFAEGVPLIKGTLEYDNARVIGSGHMYSVPDLIMRTGTSEDKTQYTYYCSGTEPLRLKCPHVTHDPPVLENILKYESSYDEEEDHDYARPGNSNDGGAGETKEEDGTWTNGGKGDGEKEEGVDRGEKEGTDKGGGKGGP